jgi:putative membrane protein
MMFERNPFLARWCVTSIAVLAAAHVVSGISYDSFGALLVAALILGVLNAVLRPILLLLSLPLLIASLGLFALVINALLLYFVGWLVPSFHVGSFGAAFWGGVVIGIVSMASNLFLGTGKTVVRVRTGPGPVRRDRDGPGGGGPVIDV